MLIVMEAHAQPEQIDLVVEASTRMAILGDSSAGKSSLMRVLAGRVTPDGGSIFWDGTQTDITSREARAVIGYLPQNPTFKPVSVWRLLGLPGPDAFEPQHQTLLRRLGGWRLIASLPRGLNQKIAANQMTRNEARALRLAAILGSQQCLWCLDAPIEGLDRRAAGRRLKTILEHAGSRTVIVSMSEPLRISSFDRVVVLRSGRICFDGDPEQWRDWRRQVIAGNAEAPTGDTDTDENTGSRS